MCEPALHSRNACQHITRATLYGNLQVKGRRPEARTTLCASLRNRKALQHVARAALYGNLQEKCRAPEPRTTLCASLRSRNACQHFTRASSKEIYGKNAAPQLEPRTRTHTLREHVQSKCISTFHKSHFIRKFTGKVPQSRVSPECGHTLCASRRSRNACRDCTRATSYGNSQEKGSRPEQAP